MFLNELIFMFYIIIAQNININSFFQLNMYINNIDRK